MKRTDHPLLEKIEDDRPFIPYMKNDGFGFGCMKIGFCMDPKIFNKEMERLKVPEPPPFLVPGVGGSAIQLHIPHLPYSVAIITLNPLMDAPLLVDLGTIVHEATHVKQYICEALGEDKPGMEYEAYTVGAISEFCFEHYLHARQLYERRAAQRSKRAPKK